MAKFRYQHIKSSVEGKAPTAAQIKVAEIGVNDFASDEKLFIKNSEGDVVDFPRGYSRQYLDDKEMVIAESLVDLNDRKLDASAYTPTDLTNYYTKSETSGATELDNAFNGKQNVLTAGEGIDITNDVISVTSGSTYIEEQLEVIAASLNDLEDRKLDKTEMPDLGDLEEVIAVALNDLEERKADKDEFNDDFEAIAASLNDLEDKKLDASAYTPVDLTNYYTKSETSGASEIQDALDEKANASNIPSVSGYADSVQYNSTSKYVEFYHGGTSGTKVFEYDASPFLVDGMVESVVVTSVTSGGSTVEVLEITWNSAAGSQVTDIPLSDIFDSSLYYTKSETSGASEIQDALDGKSDSGHTHDDRYYTKSETSGATELTDAFSGKSDTGHTHSEYATKVGDLDNVKLKKITQSDYDALVQAGTTDANTLYIITD